MGAKRIQPDELATVLAALRRYGSLHTADLARRLEQSNTWTRSRLLRLTANGRVTRDAQRLWRVQDTITPPQAAIDDNTARKLIDDYRKSHPEIAGVWDDILDESDEALTERVSEFVVDHSTRKWVWPRPTKSLGLFTQMFGRALRPTKPTGGRVNYYLAPVDHPRRHETQKPYTAECEDLIAALALTFDEACIFKAIWRSAAARLGPGKPGGNSLYDAEKMVHYAGHVLVTRKREAGE